MTEKMTMQANNKNLFFLTVSALTFLLAGCPVVQEPLEVIFKPDPVTQSQSSSMANRFEQAAPSGQTAVESAVELSKENTKLFDRMTMLQQKNLELAAENRQLKDQVAVLGPDLEQARKELNEANDLLIDMTTELNNWKMQILGFQGEMRDADTEQLRALLKILEILGGEVQPTASGEPHPNLATASLNGNSKPE